MKNTILCFFFAVGFFGIASGQNDDNSDIQIISHRVLLGETVRLISVKYLVTPAEIYKLNKFAVDGISEGMLIQIPLDKSKTAKHAVSSHNRKAKRNAPVEAAVKDQFSEHLVEAGETLSEISKNYGVSISEIKKVNNHLDTRGLKVGETILVPSKD